MLWSNHGFVILFFYHSSISAAVYLDEHCSQTIKIHHKLNKLQLRPWKVYPEGGVCEVTFIVLSKQRLISYMKIKHMNIQAFDTGSGTVCRSYIRFFAGNAVKGMHAVSEKICGTDRQTIRIPYKFYKVKFVRKDTWRPSKPLLIILHVARRHLHIHHRPHRRDVCPVLSWFRCYNGLCIPPWEVCNFVNNCGDRSDESLRYARCPYRYYSYKRYRISVIFASVCGLLVLGGIIALIIYYARCWKRNRQQQYRQEYHTFQ